MFKIETINILYDKDDKIAYHKLLELEEISCNSNELYKYFNEFIKMLNNEKSFIRVRGFRLICKQAKWDIDNLINSNINKILLELDNEKPTAVRQCLAALNNLLIYKPELLKIIQNKLDKIDLSKYKDTIKPLIKKDIQNIMNLL